MFQLVGALIHYITNVKCLHAVFLENLSRHER